MFTDPAEISEYVWLKPGDEFIAILPAVIHAWRMPGEVLTPKNTDLPHYLLKIHN